ncbi:TOBE domain protein [compost metagenome]
MEDAAGTGLPGRIALRSFVGARVQYVVALPGGGEIIADTPTNGPQSGLAAGEEVWLGVRPQHVYATRRVGAEAVA